MSQSSCSPTLRGNLGSETDAMLDCLGSDFIAVSAPCFPSSGRTLVGGYLLVDGLPLHKTNIAIDPKTPVKYKAIIAGALGYFILPFDLLPDFLPFAGLADDWAALIAAVSYVFTSISQENKDKAREKLHSLFPKAGPEDLGDLA